MHGDAPPISPLALRFIAVLLLAADTLFLWMFFAADSVPHAVLHGRVTGGHGPEFAMAASRFAAHWKHGMVGNSPVYMPGFFAVGVPTWLWSMGRPVRRLACEWVVLVAAAAAAAALLAPIGGERAIGAFELAFGVVVEGPPLPLSPRGMALSLFTLFTWTVDLVCVQLAIGRRSVSPLAAPALLNVVMLVLRPWAMNDFTTQWIADVSRSDPVAVGSLLAVPVLLAGLVWYQFRRLRVCGSPGRAWERKVHANLS